MSYYYHFIIHLISFQLFQILSGNERKASGFYFPSIWLTYCYLSDSLNESSISSILSKKGSDQFFWTVSQLNNVLLICSPVLPILNVWYWCFDLSTVVYTMQLIQNIMQLHISMQQNLNAMSTEYHQINIFITIK